MKRKSLNVAVMVLAFSVGIGAAGLFYCGPLPALPEIPEPVPPMPPATESGVTLEMVFVLDTTGSMGGLLDGAKEKIWSIVNEVQQRESRPGVRVGLVAYRDRGDSYTTQITPVTDDLDKVYSSLMDLEAGGGDHPENVRRALADGVGNAGWSKPRGNLAQMIFLVGDAPPQNYSNEPDVFISAELAVRNNMIVNTIQCGGHEDTRRIWQAIASRGQGKYFSIAQNGGVTTIETPFDQRLAELGRSIGETYIAYGEAGERGRNMESRAEAESKVAANASPTAKADRSLNKALNKNAYNGDLLQDIENGKTTLRDVKESDLPSDLRALPVQAREAEVSKRLEARKKLRGEIIDLSKRRDAFLKDEKKRSGSADGFDDAVSAALAQQLSRKGIR